MFVFQIPTERRDCHMIPEEGSILCEKPGICKYFNNSYFTFLIFLSLSLKFKDRDALVIVYFFVLLIS